MPFHRYARVRGLARSASFVFFLSNAFTAAAQTSVTTYHNDNYRTGWNNAETTPTPSNVNASQFGLLATVAVDDQVDAQPLLVSNVNITAGTHQGLHNVVHVVTGNDTVYAIDANAGTILLRNHQRQRPALLEANGNIYAGFGSFCDFSANLSRGWLLGWNAATLAPLAANQLFDTQATSPDVISNRCSVFNNFTDH